MSLEVDAILDRRRLRRNVSLWRIVAIIAVVSALALFAASQTGSQLAIGNYVAELEVTGIIIDDEERDQAIRDLVKNDNAKALMVTIESPGGTTSGSEGLYLALREVAQHKPVVAVMGGIAASGGYITAIGADHIIARGNTITGSIGVLFQNTEFSKLLKTIGVDVELVTSGPLKAKPSPFEPLDEQGRAALNALIKDSYGWFLDLVIERRNLTPERARILSDGRVYTGRMALEAKLIDQIGGKAEAREWLETQKDISADLPLETLEYGDRGPFMDRVTGSMISSLMGKSLNLKRLTLDGLVSVWQP